MITLAFGELSYFLENSPLAELDRRRKRLARRAGAEHSLDGFSYSFAGAWPGYQLVAGFFFVGFVLARFVTLSPVGAVLTAIRQNPLRTAALGH